MGDVIEVLRPVNPGVRPAPPTSNPSDITVRRTAQNSVEGAWTPPICTGDPHWSAADARHPSHGEN